MEAGGNDLMAATINCIKKVNIRLNIMVLNTITNCLTLWKLETQNWYIDEH